MIAYYIGVYMLMNLSVLSVILLCSALESYNAQTGRQKRIPRVVNLLVSISQLICLLVKFFSILALTTFYFKQYMHRDALNSPGALNVVMLSCGI